MPVSGLRERLREGKNGLELEPVDNNGAGLELELESATPEYFLYYFKTGCL